MDKTLCLWTFFSCHFVCVCVLTEATWKLVSRLMSRAQLAVRDPPTERRTGSWYQEILIRWPSILHHQQVKLMTFPSNVIIREKVLCCDNALLLVKNHFGLRKDHVLVSLWLQIGRYKPSEKRPDVKSEVDCWVSLDRCKCLYSMTWQTRSTIQFYFSESCILLCLNSPFYSLTRAAGACPTVTPPPSPTNLSVSVVCGHYVIIIMHTGLSHHTQPYLLYIATQ